MDLTKFVALLNDQALYLARADTMEDKFEGSFSEATLWARENFFREHNPGSDIAETMRVHAEQFKMSREQTFLNCWHMNDGESAAMWGLYLRSGEGIAITTTYRALRQALLPYHDFLEFGKVDYRDYDSDPRPMPDLNGYFPYFFKRKSFEHEREFRTVLWDRVGTFISQEQVTHCNEGLGIKLPVNLNQFIEAVHIAPGSNGMFRDCVIAVAERFGLTARVTQSALDAEPLY